jgi:hypothetical protein
VALVTESGVLLHGAAKWTTMRPVGKHSAPVEGRAERRRIARTAAPLRSTRRLLLLALGVTTTLVAWGFLVWAAIDFGGQARSGATTAWAFLALATIGAAACLFITLILAGKVIDAFHSPLHPPTHTLVPPGGRRARR